MPVAKIRSIQYDKTHHIYDVQLTEGNLVIGTFGCIDGKSTVPDSIDSRQYTCIDETGDFYYTHLPLKKNGLVVGATSANDARTQKELIEINKNITVPIFLALGNHDGGNAGHGVTNFDDAKAKMEASVESVRRFYEELNPAEKILLASGQPEQKIHLPARFYLRRFFHRDEHITFVVTLDTSLLPADQEQLGWLEKVVMPELAQHTNAEVILSGHHSLAATLGERMNATQEKNKYPPPHDKDTAGNQHHHVARALMKINFPISRCINFTAHEHTASVFQTEDLQSDLKKFLPKITIVSGNGGANSNKSATGKVFRAPLPGLDFVQSGYGHFRFTLLAKEKKIKLEYLDAESNLRDRQKTYDLSDGHSDLAIVQAPEIIKTQEIKLFLVIVNCLKEGRLDLIKLLLASHFDDAHDSQLSHDSYHAFLDADFRKPTELESLRELLTQLEKLIAFFLNPLRSGYCTHFYNQVCLVYFILRNAWMDMQIQQKTLQQLDVNAYFYKGAVPIPTATALPEETEEDLADSENAIKTEAKKKAKPIKIPAPKASKKIENTPIREWAQQTKIQNADKFKSHVKNAIAEYLRQHLENKNSALREYFTEQKTHWQFANACLLYRLLEDPNQDALLLVKYALKTADPLLQKLIFDTVANSRDDVDPPIKNDEEIFGIVLRDQPCYKEALNIAKGFNPPPKKGESELQYEDRLYESATRIMLDEFFELRPGEASESYQTLFNRENLSQLTRHDVFRPHDLIVAETIFHLCFWELGSLESRATPNFMKRSIHWLSRGRLFHPACQAKNDFDHLKKSLFGLFLKAENQGDLLRQIAEHETLQAYFRIDLVSNPAHPTISPCLDVETTEAIQNLTKLFSLFASYVPDDDNAMASLKIQLLAKPYASAHLPVEKPKRQTSEIQRPLLLVAR